MMIDVHVSQVEDAVRSINRDIQKTFDREEMHIAFSGDGDDWLVYFDPGMHIWTSLEAGEIDGANLENILRKRIDKILKKFSKLKLS